MSAAKLFLDVIGRRGDIAMADLNFLLVCKEYNDVSSGGSHISIFLQCLNTSNFSNDISTVKSSSVKSPEFELPVALSVLAEQMCL